MTPYKTIRGRKTECALAIAVAALLIQLVGPKLTRWARYPAVGGMGIAEIKGPSLPSVRRRFYLYLPPDYEPDTIRHPGSKLVLYLHGAGDRRPELARLLRRGLPRMLWEGGTYPAVVAFPQCRVGSTWRPEDLIVLLDQLSRQLNIDRAKVILMGESMGGYGVWTLATHAPERFCAAVPMCGGGDPATAERLTGMSLWVFHGTEDEVVPLSESSAMVDAVREAGGSVKFTALDGVGHNLTRLPLRDDLVQWIAEQ